MLNKIADMITGSNLTADDIVDNPLMAWSQIGN